MSEKTIEMICVAWIATALAIHLILFFVPAPFGRHTSSQWGPLMNNQWGWFIMELPSLLIMVFVLSGLGFSSVSFSWILFLLWIMHYFNRACVYPLRIRPTPKKIPVVIVCSAIFFNLVNAGLNGYYLWALAPVAKYSLAWLSAPHCWVGLLLFITGFGINGYADHRLINLRKKGEIGYKVPTGFLFEYISSPNLFGEIMEWTGFAIMAWNLPAVTFMVWTWANLVPRAKTHHDWYKRNFPDYPKNRKAVIPFLY